MKPHEFNELVQRLMGVYSDYGKTQQLRANLVKALISYRIKPEHKK